MNSQHFLTAVSRSRRFGRGWRLGITLGVLASILIVAFSSTRANAAEAKKQCTQVTIARVSVGQGCVQTDGRRHVNAWMDRYVGGSSVLVLYECAGDCQKIALVQRVTSGRDIHLFTPIRPYRAPDYYYYATLTIVWSNHGTPAQEVPTRVI
jgi:hypothetical protein